MYFYSCSSLQSGPSALCAPRQSTCDPVNHHPGILVRLPKINEHGEKLPLHAASDFLRGCLVARLLVDALPLTVNGEPQLHDHVQVPKGQVKLALLHRSVKTPLKSPSKSRQPPEAANRGADQCGQSVDRRSTVAMDVACQPSKYLAGLLGPPASLFHPVAFPAVRVGLVGAFAAVAELVEWQQPSATRTSLEAGGFDCGVFGFGHDPVRRFELVHT
jgi:hypothetical protein